MSPGRQVPRSAREGIDCGFWAHGHGGQRYSPPVWIRPVLYRGCVADEAREHRINIHCGRRPRGRVCQFRSGHLHRLRVPDHLCACRPQRRGGRGPGNRRLTREHVREVRQGAPRRARRLLVKTRDRARIQEASRKRPRVAPAATPGLSSRRS